MKERFLTFLLSIILCSSAFAAERVTQKNKTVYGNIYPSTLNDPGNGKNKVVRAAQMQMQPKTRTTSVRRNVAQRPKAARTAVNNTPKAASQPTQTRRVVSRPTAARSGVRSNVNVRNIANAKKNSQKRSVVARESGVLKRLRSSGNLQLPSTTSTKTVMSSQQCFAGYKECMDSYCERTDTAYNRCYCSARLAQIDSRYQPKIDTLVQEIIKLKYNTDATDAEIKQYWDETVGIYTHTNPWVNIDNALNIDWADMESRVRGQNAFAAGHTYCVNHLRACSYMATNMRDAYRSEISRDCTSYEKILERIQTAAESVIESYNQ